MRALREELELRRKTEIHEIEEVRERNCIELFLFADIGLNIVYGLKDVEGRG